MSELREHYDRHGYAIARDAIDTGLAEEMVAHVHWLRERHPDVRPEQFHHHMLVDDPFVHRLVGDDRLVDIAAEFVGQDVALFAAHYIAKIPGTGQAVHWHQDGYYWPLEPMEVTTLWVAGTDSSVDNGCMRVIPGTQDAQLEKEVVGLDTERFVLGVGLDAERVDEASAVDIELQPGDVSVHNPNIVHGSNANTSDRWRVGLTLRYIPTSTWVKTDGHRCILLRGETHASVRNTYAPRPTFDAPAANAPEYTVDALTVYARQMGE